MKTKILNLLFLSILFLSCSNKNHDLIDTVYSNNTEINSIEIKGPFKVFVTESTTNDIRVVASAYIYEKLNIQVSSTGELSAVVGDFGNKYNANKTKLELYVPAKYLNEIELYGAAYCEINPVTPCPADAKYKLSNASMLIINSKSVFSKSLNIELLDASSILLKKDESIVVEENFNVDNSDASTMILNKITVKGDSKFKLNDASKVIISGESQSNVDLKTEDASKFEGINFLCSNFNLNASGSSHAEVTINKELSIIMSGASKLKYKKGSQEFKIVNISSSGAANIQEVK